MRKSEEWDKSGDILSIDSYEEDLDVVNNYTCINITTLLYFFSF